MAIPEGKVLRPASPSVTDEKDWPIFELSHAEVRDSKTGDFASLLHASAGSPVTVVGKLKTQVEVGGESGSLEEDYGHLLVSRRHFSKSTTIQIARVTQRSYGEFGNGQIGLWAAGEAGWFEIKPSRQYNSVYLDMIEAVRVFYFMSDIYSNADSKGGQPNAQDLFESYARSRRTSCKKPEEAADIFYSHKKFLASAMSGDQDTVKWSQTPFYRHLRKKHPEAFSPRTPNPTTTSIEEPPKRRGRPPGSKSNPASLSPPNLTLAAAEEPPKRRGRPPGSKNKTTSLSPPSPAPPPIEDPPKRRGRPPGSKNKIISPAAMVMGRRSRATNDDDSSASSHRALRSQSGHDANDERWARAKELWQFMQRIHLLELVDETLEGFSNAIVDKFEVDDPDTAANYILAHAADLVSMMQVKRKRNIEWTEQPIYQELLHARIPAATERKMHRLVLQSRSTPLSATTPISTTMGSASHSEEAATTSSSSEDSSIGGRPRRHPKSALRPKSQKSSGKGKGPARNVRSFTSAHAAADDDEDMEDSVHVASPTKRKTLATLESKPRKRKLRSNRDEVTDSSSEMEQSLPLRWKKEPTTPTSKAAHVNSDLTKTHIKVRYTVPSNRTVPEIIRSPLPDSTPTGPGDTWECNQDGCSHKVYGGSSEEGQVLIQEHIEEHTTDYTLHSEEDEGEQGPHFEALSLVTDESNKLHLPVSNLVKRIREMAEAQGLRDDVAFGSSNGVRTQKLAVMEEEFPKPIVRRY